MRIVVHGQEAFGKAVLEKLIARGENVVAVCCAPNKEGRPEDPLAALARDKGIPLHQPKSWKTPEALELMKSFDADVCLMAYVLLFVPQPVLDAPRLGPSSTIPPCCPTIVGPPRSTGRSRWANATGLSIFWPDEGLDEGPILLQKTVEIGPDETLGDIYFKKLFPLGVDAMMESLDLVKAGNAPEASTRARRRLLRELVQEGHCPARLVEAGRRGLQYDPRCQSRPRRLGHDQGRQARHLRQRARDRHGTPGEVVSIDGNGMPVAAEGRVRS